MSRAYRAGWAVAAVWWCIALTGFIALGGRLLGWW